MPGVVIALIEIQRKEEGMINLSTRFSLVEENSDGLWYRGCKIRGDRFQL